MDLTKKKSIREVTKRGTPPTIFSGRIDFGSAKDIAVNRKWDCFSISGSLADIED